MDDAVVKATDENLTSENWEYILDVCDRVASTPSGPQHAVSSLIKSVSTEQLGAISIANHTQTTCTSKR